MNEDRFENNRSLYISSMIFFLLGFFLLGYTLYLLPGVLFGIIYDIHYGYFLRIEQLQELLGVSHQACEYIIIATYIVVSLILLAIAMNLSNRIENRKLGLSSKPVNTVSWRERHQGLILSFKLIFFIVVLLLIGNYFGLEI